MDRITATHGFPFRVGFTGHSGHLRLEPLPPVQGPDPLSSLPDFILPPAFEEDTKESLKKEIEDKYLCPLLDPDEFTVEKDGRQWEFDWFDRARVPLEPSLPRSIVVPKWELPFRRNKDETGIWHPASTEIEVVELMGGAQDYGQQPHMPGPAKDFVRGSTNNRPFWPGGQDGSQSSGRTIPEGARTGEWVREVLDGGHAQAVPPGFKQGIDLGFLDEFPYQWKCAKEQTLVAKDSRENLTSLSLTFDDLFKKTWEENLEEHQSEDEEEVKAEKEEEYCADTTHTESLLIDEILVNDTALSPLQSDRNAIVQKEAWVAEGIEDVASNFHELVPDMALDFPFELDKFQKEAIYYLEKGESVFVAAHTSAGKTVVAEYAFALVSKHYTKAVYTAPIKTISNQKYRDFCGKFDVGLLTGDVSLRPEASCLIMTTEILRSMLYKGADIIRDIEWVIFDEVHYVNDVERGVVWEEVIIMLPRHINIVLLSATVPNTREFADWIGRTKQKKIHVTGTSKRPVPLEHCLFYSGELYTICQNEDFLPQGLQAAKYAYQKKTATTSGGSSGKTMVPAAFHGGGQIRHEKFGRGRNQKHYGSQNTGGLSGAGGPYPNNRGPWRSESTLWLLLINKLSKMSLLPVIIFCFSKNRCDRSVDSMKGTDLTSSSEKSKIRVFCKKAFSRLKGSDRKLPQVIRVEKLLERGIGVHHAGLLPIVKEVVEMLFCQGVIKVLFSTETFAMGVNAPARTVVFDTLRKFDGKDFRSLLPGEYIQMAGRAGRRGLDDVGTVVIMCRDDIPDERPLKHVIVGTPTRLESQFRLMYTMILHLLRLEELKVEDMLKRSFAEFHAQKKLPEIELLLLKFSQSSKVIECIKGEPAIEEYLELVCEADELRDHMSEVFMQSHTAQQFLSPGRVVVVRSQSVEDHLLGVVLKSSSAMSKQYIVLVLTTDTASSTETSMEFPTKLQGKHTGYFPGGYFVPPKGKRDNDEYYTSATPRKGSGVIKIKLPYRGVAAGTNYEVIGVEHKHILSICDCKINKIDQVGLLEEPSTAVYSKTVQQLLEKKTEGNKYPPALDPLKDLKLNNVALVENYRHYNALLQKMTENKCHGCIKLKEHMALMKEQKKQKEEVNALKFQMSDEALQQMPDFQGRIDVLREIGCIDYDLVVQIKGRVACEMNSGEELICTECLFDNQLEDLEPEEAVALMSALVFQQKNTSEPNLSPKLCNAKKRLFDTAIRLGQLQAQRRVAVDPEEYVQDNLKFGLVEVVYEWAKGTPFAEICELTDVPEGQIVRTIARLDETCREFQNAASIMGNLALYKKMETASSAIKRDIVFAASLYITGVE